MEYLVVSDSRTRPAQRLYDGELRHVTFIMPVDVYVNGDGTILISFGVLARLCHTSEDVVRAVAAELCKEFEFYESDFASGHVEDGLAKAVAFVVSGEEASHRLGLMFCMCSTALEGHDDAPPENLELVRREAPELMEAFRKTKKYEDTKKSDSPEFLFIL